MSHTSCGYAAFWFQMLIGNPAALQIARRSLGERLRPAMTWYIAVRSTPARRAISAPDIPFLSSLIFIFVSNLIMMMEYSSPCELLSSLFFSSANHAHTY
jgi:hypothetical protein